MIDFDEIKREAQSAGVGFSLLLKEKIHFVILDYLFREGVFSTLVFQGGTALRLVYGGVRYSEDLDFVLRKKSAGFFRSFSKVLERLPSYVDRLIPFAHGIRMKAQKETETFNRYTLSMEIESLKAKDKTHIEVAQVPSYDHEIVMIHEKSIPLNPAVCVESPQEILADKLTAFGSREYVKGRDIWDLFFLLNSMKVSLDPEVERMVSRKIADYRLKKVDFSSRLKRNIEVLREKGPLILKQEMDRFLGSAYRRVYSSQYGAISSHLEEVLSQFQKEVATE